MTGQLLALRFFSRLGRTPAHPPLDDEVIRVVRGATVHPMPG